VTALTTTSLHGGGTAHDGQAGDRVVDVQVRVELDLDFAALHRVAGGIKDRHRERAEGIRDAALAAHQVDERRGDAIAGIGDPSRRDRRRRQEAEHYEKRGLANQTSHRCTSIDGSPCC